MAEPTNASAGSFAVAILGALVVCAPVAGRAQAQPRTHTIIIENMQFRPATLTVRAGDRIVWRNEDLVPHTATLAGHFDSGTIEGGKTWGHVAGDRGILPYVCSFHPTMKATLVVQ